MEMKQMWQIVIVPEQEQAFVKKKKKKSHDSLWLKEPLLPTSGHI